MRIAIGADHGGWPLYRSVIEEVGRLGHDAVGVNPQESIQPGDDYPDYAVLIGERIERGDCERGILICGSGVGASVAANKLVGIRAALCHDTYSAHQGVEHDNMNVLCLGARVVGIELALELVRAYVNANFSGEERHKRRLEKIRKLETG
ncbi:MAG: rpiB [Acidobacteriales bacterium]|nr:rpiB [Terriglobales bacterium]